MPSKTVSIKIDEGLERSLQEIVNRAQTIGGERVTFSDVVRDMLSSGVAKETGHIRTDVMPLSEPYTPVGRRILMPVPAGHAGYTVERNPSIKARVGSRVRTLSHKEMEEKEKETLEITMADAHPHVKQAAMSRVSNTTGESLMIPTFVISANPTWHWSEGLENEDTYIAEAKKSIAIREDEEIIKTISNGVPADHSFVMSGGGYQITARAYRNGLLAEMEVFSSDRKAKTWMFQLAIDEGIDESELTRMKEWPYEEVAEVLNALMSAQKESPIVLDLKISGLADSTVLSSAAGLLWEHQVDVATIVYHPYRYGFVDAWRGKQRGVEWPLENRVEDVAFLSSIACPRDTVYVLSKPEITGRIVIENDVNVIEANDPLRLTMGRMVWESIGIALINDYCTSKITIV